MTRTRPILSRTCLAALATALLACNPTHQRAAPRDAPSAGPRVASQTVLSDEVLWELGPEVRARVVAVSRMADDARYSTIAGRWDEAVPRVMGTSETLLALRPDVVFLASFTAAETRALLSDHGVPSIVLEGFNGFADYRRHVRTIAEGAGEPDAGEAVIARFDERLATIKAAAPAPAAGATAPAAISWNEGMVAGKSTTFHDIAVAAGLRNLAADQGIEGHRSLPIERVVAWDPAVVIIACEAGPDTCAASERAFAARPGFSATRAAREGGVIAIPSGELYSVGAAMLDVAARLQTRVHGRRPDTAEAP